MNSIIQYYIDDNGNESRFIDKFQFQHSRKMKASDIEVLEGSSATPEEIADEINRHLALSRGTIVGYLK